MKTSFALWIVTLVICSFILIFYAPLWSTLGLIMLVIDVLLGIVLFISYILKLENNLRIWFGNTVGSLISVVVFLLSLVSGVIIVFGGVMLNDKYLKIKPITTAVKSSSSKSSLVNERLIFDQVQIGSSGDDVKVLQLLLSQDKSIYSGPISGYFGAITRDGVNQFQKKYKFEQTGVADLITRNKLSEVYSYQTREYWLSMVRLMPTSTEAAQTSQDASNNNSGKWGVAEKVAGDNVTYHMNVGNDPKMATAQEIFDALNIYRTKKGVHGLNWDGNLANFAQERANFFATNGTDAHAGMIAYVDNVENRKKLGFLGIGENGGVGYRLTGTHLIEWIFSSDAGHENNQLDPSYTDVGIGVSGTGVAIIFGYNRF